MPLAASTSFDFKHLSLHKLLSVQAPVSPQSYFPCHPCPSVSSLFLFSNFEIHRRLSSRRSDLTEVWGPAIVLVSSLPSITLRFPLSVFEFHRHRSCLPVVDLLYFMK